MFARFFTAGAVGEASPVHTQVHLLALICSMLQRRTGHVLVLTRVKPTVTLSKTEVQPLSALFKHPTTCDRHPQTRGSNALSERRLILGGGLDSRRLKG